MARGVAHMSRPLIFRASRVRHFCKATKIKADSSPASPVTTDEKISSDGEAELWPSHKGDASAPQGREPAPRPAPSNGQKRLAVQNIACADFARKGRFAPSPSPFSTALCGGAFRGKGGRCLIVNGISFSL